MWVGLSNAWMGWYRLSGRPIWWLCRPMRYYRFGRLGSMVTVGRPIQHTDGLILSIRWADVVTASAHAVSLPNEVVTFNWPHTFRWKYRRVLVADGNFSLDHMRMRRPDLDVGLTDGEGYVVESKQYQQHLKESIEIKEVWMLCSWNIQDMEYWHLQEINLQEP